MKPISDESIQHIHEILRIEGENNNPRLCAVFCFLMSNLLHSPEAREETLEALKNLNNRKMMANDLENFSLGE